ncbi:MAG TPA: tetratricopeptide repeat protein [Bacteroidales bacterium]|nr:tetratricopeptide repeat protein [Bacteroidales bacterium]HPS61436.1 tetratricopeptide repeat protein [Bacteroidales bacterium]
MKNLCLIAVTLTLIFASCTGNRKGDQNYAVGSPAWRVDTARVNRILGHLPRYQIANPDSVMQVIRKAGMIARTCGYKEGEGNAVFEEGNLLNSQNRCKEALEKFTAAQALALQYHFTLLEARCLERIASIRMNDDTDLAFKIYLKALLLFEREKDSAGLAKVYNVLGVFQTDRHQFDSAERFFNAAIRINRHSGNTYYLIENKGNLARMYLEKDDLEKAGRLFHELVGELCREHDSTALQIIYYQLAMLHQEKGNDDSTLVFLDRAMKIAEPVGDTVLLTTLCGFKGELLLRKGVIGPAVDLLQHSVALARAINDIETEAEALKFLAQADSMSGNYREEIRKRETIAILKDTMVNRSLRNDMKQSELQYENEKKKSIIEQQQAQIKAAMRIKRLFIALLIMSVFLIGLLFTVLFLQRKNLRKSRQLADNVRQIKDLQIDAMKKDQEIDRLRIEKMAEELQYKERELLVHVMSVEQRNELLTDIGRRIRDSFSNQNGEDHIQKVNEIIASIKMQLNQNGESVLFNQQFTQVHESFQANLVKEHPTLTKSELKFCAYLRLNLSGSQIAGNLNVTQEAIRKTRYRIRKKMNLTPETSLETYLTNF